MSGPYATYARPSTSQSVAYTATAGVISNAFGAHTKLVRVILTTAGYIKFDHQSNLAATTSDLYMSAGIPEYFSVNPGEKVSAIRESASGTLYVTEMTH